MGRHAAPRCRRPRRCPATWPCRGRCNHPDMDRAPARSCHRSRRRRKSQPATTRALGSASCSCAPRRPLQRGVVAITPVSITPTRIPAPVSPSRFCATSAPVVASAVSGSVSLRSRSLREPIADHRGNTAVTPGRVSSLRTSPGWTASARPASQRPKGAAFAVRAVPPGWPRRGSSRVRGAGSRDRPRGGWAQPRARPRQSPHPPSRA